MQHSFGPKIVPCLTMSFIKCTTLVCLNALSAHTLLTDVERPQSIHFYWLYIFETIA